MNHYAATALAPAARNGSDNFPAAAAGEPAWTIGQLARRFELTHRTLRFYESRGLLNPVRHGRYRVYGPKDAERLAAIVKAKKLGLTLTAIGQMLGGAGAEQTLRLSRDTCLAQIAVLERKLAQTEEALAELRALCGLPGGRPTDRR